MFCALAAIELVPIDDVEEVTEAGSEALDEYDVGLTVEDGRTVDDEVGGATATTEVFEEGADDSKLVKDKVGVAATWELDGDDVGMPEDDCRLVDDNAGAAVARELDGVNDDGEFVDDEAEEAVTTDPGEEPETMLDVVVDDIASDELEVAAWYVLDADRLC